MENYIKKLRVEENGVMVDKQIDYEALANLPALSTVATSGSYDDLTNVPIINGVALSGEKTSSDLKLGLVNSYGGFQAGLDASASTGGAVGCEANATVGFAGGHQAYAAGGGAVGSGASATSGFAGGVDAKASYAADGVTTIVGAIAIGHSAHAQAANAVQLGTGTNATENTLKFRDYQLLDSNGRIPTGRLKNSSGGFQAGNNASATSGGAVGYDTRATSGGAIGFQAYAESGFAGGHQAQARYKADGTTLVTGAVAIGYRAIAQSPHAVQLGTGTNTNQSTLQFRDYQLLDSNGKIPADRINNATNEDPGIVKPDGETITVDDDGAIHAVTTEVEPQLEEDGVVTWENVSVAGGSNGSGGNIPTKTSQLTNDSDFSTNASVDAKISNIRPKLYAPIIKISGTTLTIKNPTKNKDYVGSYDVYNTATNNVIRNTKKTTVDLSSLGIVDGTYNIAVKAKGTIFFNGISLYDDSDYSNVLTYTHTKLPALKSGSGWYKGTTDKSTITEITFDNAYEVTGNETESWDASDTRDESVMCYLNGTSLTIKPIFSKNRVISSDCTSMFSSFSSLTTINNLTALDTSNVTKMYAMFSNCSSLTSLDVSNFDTSSVTTMEFMFSGCNALITLDLSSFDTSSVTNIAVMFQNCKALTSLDLSNFDTSNVTNMRSMFNGCNALITLNLSSFDTSNVTDMACMFQGCQTLTPLDVSNWDTSNVTDMSSMFRNCEALTALDVSNFDTSNVTNMSSMFYYCQVLTSLDVSNFDTSNVTRMSFMFGNCEALTALDVSNFDTSNVTSMNGMFQCCKALTSLDVSNFDTSNVTSMDQMFWVCSKLTSLNLTNFDTSNTTSMCSMFQQCNVLTLDCSSLNWDVTNVTKYTDFNTGAPGVTPPVWVN